VALIKCNECNTEISDTALSCPKCGFKKTIASEANNVKKWVLIIVAALALIVVYQIYYSDGFAEDRKLNQNLEKANKDVDEAFENLKRTERKFKDL
jgi:hypothetical protein